MPEYKNLDLSERFERVVENIKADNDTPDIENCREFYYLFNEALEQLQLTQSELITIGVDKRARVEFPLALLNISKFANGSKNHLLNDSKMLDKTINSINEFTINLNDYLSKKDIQEKGQKMSVLIENIQKDVNLRKTADENGLALSYDEGSGYFDFNIKSPSEQFKKVLDLVTYYYSEDEDCLIFHDTQANEVFAMGMLPQALKNENDVANVIKIIADTLDAVKVLDEEEAETTQSMEQILNEKYRVVFKLDVIGEVYVSNWMNYEGAEDFLEMVGANLGGREFDFKFTEPESDLYQKLDGTIVSENATEIKSAEDIAVVKEMNIYVRDNIRNSGNEEKIMKIFNDLKCCSIDVNYKNGIISFTTPKSHENYISKTLKTVDVDYDVKNIANTLCYVVPLSPRELKVDDVVFGDVDNTLRDGVMEEITMNVINKMPDRVRKALALKEWYAGALTKKENTHISQNLGLVMPTPIVVEDDEAQINIIKNILKVESLDSVVSGDMWVSIDSTDDKYSEHGIFVHVESKELDNGEYSDDIFSVSGYKNYLSEDGGYVASNFSDAIFNFEVSKKNIETVAEEGQKVADTYGISVKQYFNNFKEFADEKSKAADDLKITDEAHEVKNSNVRRNR